MAEHPRHEVESKVDSSQGALVSQMNRAVRISGAPPQWVCNAQKEHKEEGYMYWKAERGILNCPCLCFACLKKKHPQLEEGPLFAVHSEFPLLTLEAKGFVGVYDRTEPVQSEIEVPCTKCGGLITLDGKTAERFNRAEEEVVHLECLSKEGRRTLQAIGYKFGYLLRGKQEARPKKNKKAKGAAKPKARGRKKSKEE